MTIALKIAVFAIGATIVLGTLGSAVRTVVLPRGIPVRLGAFVFVWVRRVFDLRVSRKADYKDRDRIMAHYAPVALLSLAMTWLSMILLGYTAMFWSLGEESVEEAFVLSGSSLFTLGFVRPEVLLALCVLGMAPEAPWSSDRAPEYRRVRIMRKTPPTTARPQP